MQVQPGDSCNYKKKYKTLKRKLRMLIYEQECFAEELRRAQRKLLRISRDKSFLLDRLLQYEEIDASATDTDVTASSGSEDDHPIPPKRKKTNLGSSTTSGPVPSSSNGPGIKPGIPSMYMTASSNAVSNTSTDDTQPKKKIKLTKKTPKMPVPTSPSSQVMRPPAHPIKSPSKSPVHLASAGGASHAFSRQEYERLNRLGMAVVDHRGVTTSPDVKQGTPGHDVKRGLVGADARCGPIGHDVKRGLVGADARRGPAGHAMTREELEKHLEMKSSAKAPFMSLEKMPHILPDNIFNDNSNSCDFPDNKTTDDEDLVIDMP